MDKGCIKFSNPQWFQDPLGSFQKKMKQGKKKEKDGNKQKGKTNGRHKGCKIEVREVRYGKQKI